MWKFSWQFNRVSYTANNLDVGYCSLCQATLHLGHLLSLQSLTRSVSRWYPPRRERSSGFIVLGFLKKNRDQVWLTKELELHYNLGISQPKNGVLLLLSSWVVSFANITRSLEYSGSGNRQGLYLVYNGYMPPIG